MCAIIISNKLWILTTGKLSFRALQIRIHTSRQTYFCVYLFIVVLIMVRLMQQLMNVTWVHLHCLKLEMINRIIMSLAKDSSPIKKQLSMKLCKPGNKKQTMLVLPMKHEDSYTEQKVVHTNSLKMEYWKYLYQLPFIVLQIKSDIWTDI